jgi:thioesterase domain-containing protein
VSFVGLIDSQVHAAAAMQPVDEVTLLIAYLRYGFARVIDAEAVRSVPQEQRMLWLADAIRDIVDLPTLTSTLTPTLTPEQRAVAVAGTEKLLAQALDTFGKLTRYYPQPLPVSVTLYTAAETPSALADEARATGPYHGWDRVSPGNVRRVPIPGTHQSMVTTPHVGVLAQLINEELLCPPEEHELRGVPVWAERS